MKMNRNKLSPGLATVAIALLGILDGCSTSQTAAFNTTAANVVKDGQLFCAMETTTGPLTVALANTAGAPVKVTGQASADVAAACALINAIPVSPPANPAAAPVVSTATTLPPA
jgi:hypothetical protein